MGTFCMMKRVGVFATLCVGILFVTSTALEAEEKTLVDSHASALDTEEADFKCPAGTVGKTEKDGDTEQFATTCTFDVKCPANTVKKVKQERPGELVTTC